MPVPKKYIRKRLQRRLRSSFSKGGGSVVGVPGNYESYKILPSSVDKRMLAEDWAAVGDLLRDSMHRMQGFKR